MSRSLSEPLYERLRQAHPPDRAYSRADWDEEAMPAPVQQFLEHLLRHHSRREARRLRRARTDWVDYEHPKMEAAVRTFFDAAEAHAQVPADEWEETLRQAVTQTTAYLVRPVPVLVDFIFEDRDDALSIDRIRWRMQFFAAYGYLRDAVRAYAEQQNRDALGPRPFESVLNRIDRHVPADFSPDRWLQVLDPLFETVRHALDQEQVPASVLRTLFEEKGQSAIVGQIDAYVKEGHEQIGPAALRRLLDEAFDPTSPAPEPAGEKPPPPSTSPPADDDPTPLWQQFQRGRSAPARSASDSPAGGGQPLWTQFHHDQRSRAARIGGAGRTDEETSATPEMETRGERQVSKRTVPSDDGDGTQSLEVLERDVLGTARPSHRSVYINKLFAGDEAAYRQVLRRLRGADSWSDASQIIAEDVFRAHGVNIYSDPAVHFTDAAEARFRE